MLLKFPKALFISILGIIVFIGPAIFIGRVFSYNDTITHPSLTENIAKVYNKSSPIKLTDEEIDWLKQGSIEEDTPMRWMNHFYNPDSSLGILGYQSSKIWAEDSMMQSAYPKGNQTWQKAIDSYVDGDREEAFVALGHILHLIEDTSVPAHTRLDAHPLGDPYENWVRNEFGSEINFDVSLIETDQLSDAFDDLALYSNNYFFSADTIEENLLAILPTKTFFSEGKMIDCFLYRDADGKEFCIASSDKNFVNPEKRIYYLTEINHFDYFSLLGPKAVSYGAGVIELFFKEAEKQKQLEQGKSWWQKVKDSLKEGYHNVSSQFGSLFAGPSSLITYENKETTEIDEPLNSNVPESAPPSPPPTQPPASIQRPVPPSIPLPPNTVETIPISQQAAPSEPLIQEEILKPESPPEIAENKFAPVLPPIIPQFSPPLPETTAFVGGGPEEEPKIPASPPAATSTPPQVSIWFSDYRITSRQFTVNWHSSSTDISWYDVEHKIGSSSESFWQMWLASTTATSQIFQVPQDETTYYFRVKAINSQGLASGWQEISASINFYPLVINEIAWAGTSASTTADEWIELYNKTSQIIDLSGWSVVEVSPTSTTTVVTLKNTVASNSYYLIERTDDQTVVGVDADLKHNFGGNGLSNSGENLRLVDANGQIIDILNFSNGWPFGTASPDYLTMERVNSYLRADIPGNWQSNNKIIRNGFSADGLPINGTPKSQNSVFDLSFFYLYPAEETTATSTKLKWTSSYISDLKEYKVARAFGSSSSTFEVIATLGATNFFDETLESETEYYYKILACDNSDSCVESNIVSLTTLEFPFLWASSQIISVNSTSTEAVPNIALSDNNLPAVTWYTYQDMGNRFINFSQKNADASWSPPQKTAKEIYAYSFSPQILSYQNRLEILFTGDIVGEGGTPYDIFDWRAESGVWQEPKNILAGDNSYYPSAVIDNSGITHIVWIGYNASSSASIVLYRALAPDGSFLGDIQEIPGSRDGLLPQIMVDRQNKLHVIWYHWPGPPNLDGIFYSQNSQDGAGWSEGKEIAVINKPGPLPEQPELAIDKNDNLFVAWEQSGQINLIEFDGATTTQKLLFFDAGKTLNSPEVVFSSSGRSYIFWNGYTGSNHGIYFTYLKSNGQWQPIKKVFDVARKVRHPAAVVDPNNILHLVYEEGDTDSQIYYTWAEIE